MNVFIFHPLKNKILSCLSRKFISPAALIEFPSIDYGENHSSKLNPLNLFTSPNNLRGLTLQETKLVHAILLKTGVLYSNIEISRMNCAFQLFEEIPEPNLVTWNLLILECKKIIFSMILGDLLMGVLFACSALENGFFSNGYVRAGMINSFSRNFISSHGSLIPNSFVFSSALTACAALEELNLGKSIQGPVIKSGVGDDGFVGTATVDLYAKCGDMCDAMKQLKLMPVCNVVSWTAIISGFAHKGDLSSVVLVLDEMRKTEVDMNHYTVSSLFAACALSAMFNEATQIHCLILKICFCSNSVVKSSLITMYSKVGAIDSSELAFYETHDLKQIRQFICSKICLNNTQ
ncbi:hypothetical protein ACJIZ3_011302 [Penstemon smallii]|uniref:Pentatricopeptide repeat-containing protein n=1 Tax=Penstemon smallii TaxID=265156 RepID=A0ABD3UK82_9LAMI